MPDPLPRPHRPVVAADVSKWGAEVDGPEQADAVAARTAALVLHAPEDPVARERLARAVSEVGMDTLAEIWSHALPGSLAHTLWILTGLAAWCRADPEHVARLYAAGRHRAEVSHAIAGAAEPPGPEEIVALGDGLARGTWRGDLADACERSAAFARVVAAGRSELHREDLDGLASSGDPAAAPPSLRLADAGVRTANALESAAREWREGRLT